MRYYIGTVYHLSSLVECEIGDEGISRQVIRLKAESPEIFKGIVRDRWLTDVDAMVDFGPVSESKYQE